MNWIFIFVIYYLIGVGVLAWLINKDKKINPKSEIFTKKMLFLIDPVCLLWPFVLFSEIRNRGNENHVGKDDIE